MSWKTEHLKSRGGSRFAATSKMERFVIIVNSWKPLTGIIKRSILDVAAALDSPLLKSNLLVFYSNYFSQNFAVHNCHKISNNVLPKRWCLILMEYLLDNTFLKTAFYPSNLHAWLLFTKTWTLEEWHAIWKIEVIASKIEVIAAIVTDFNFYHRKLHLRCNRISGPALIRTTSLGKVASTYPITLSRVSGQLVIIFVGS